MVLEDSPYLLRAICGAHSSRPRVLHMLAISSWSSVPEPSSSISLNSSYKHRPAPIQHVFKPLSEVIRAMVLDDSPYLLRGVVGPDQGAAIGTAAEESALPWVVQTHTCN